MQFIDLSLICMRSDLQNQKPVSKSVKPFTKIINLSLETLDPPLDCLCCELPLFFWVFVSEKSDHRCNKEFGYERFTVNLVEICLFETASNESNTNSRTFEFEIKQSKIMTSSTRD